jgi:ribosomal protein L1
MVDLRHIGNVDEALAVDHRSGDRVVGATVSLPQLLCERPRIRVFATARKISPSRSTNAPCVTPQSLCALSRMASNTGARSPDEELMTCNTSAVAVC